jgi:hypothetical protein
MATKRLNSLILNSSLWEKPYYTRIVYMTMLFLKNREGIVAENFEFIKNAANVTEFELTASLDDLKSMNIYNRDMRYCGKLIEETKVGYKMLDIYGEDDGELDRKEKQRLYMRQWRALKKEEKEGLKIPDRSKKEYEQPVKYEKITNGLRFR